MLPSGPSECKIRLAVVVPMYNELGAAEICVRRILEVLPTLPVPTDLVIVDDGSDDGTDSELDALHAQLGGFEVVHQQHGGYGSALRCGAEEALTQGCNYVLFMDSDLTNPPEHIARFIPKIERGFDLVKASRFDQGGDMHAVSWRRRIFSVAGNWLARPMFCMGIADCTNGFRAIRTREFIGMPLAERGFPIILEELYWAKKMGLSTASVPTSLSERTAKQRPSAFSYRLSVLWTYLKYAFQAAVVPYPPAQHAQTAQGVYGRSQARRTNRSSINCFFR
jgi:dolichol-phosphate mannosyltransferase